jgi:hypothetical protein
VGRRDNMNRKYSVLWSLQFSGKYKADQAITIWLIRMQSLNRGDLDLETQRKEKTSRPRILRKAKKKMILS